MTPFYQAWTDAGFKTDYYQTVHAVQCCLAIARDESAIWKRTYELLWTSFGSLRWKTLTRNGFGMRSFTRSKQKWHPTYCSWSPQAAAITGPTPLLGMILSTSSKPRAGLQLVSCAWPGLFMSAVFFKPKGLMVNWSCLICGGFGVALKGCGMPVKSSFSWHYSNTHGAGMSGDCGWSKMAWKKAKRQKGKCRTSDHICTILKLLLNL